MMTGAVYFFISLRNSMMTRVFHICVLPTDTIVVSKGTVAATRTTDADAVRGMDRLASTYKDIASDIRSKDRWVDSQLNRHLVVLLQPIASEYLDYLLLARAKQVNAEGRVPLRG